MEKSNIIKDTAETITKNLPKTTKSIDNVLSIIVDMIDVILTPVQLIKINKNFTVERIKSNCQKRISEIPSKYVRKKLELNTIGPAIDALKYCFTEEDLLEMFENLLVASVDSRKIIFPSFVEIIKQLNADETKLIKFLSKSKYNQPLIDLRYVLNDNKGFYVIISNFTDIGDSILEKPELIYEYINELVRLGIIEIPDGLFIMDDNLYKGLEEHKTIIDAKKKQQKSPGKYEIEKKQFVITKYGNAFINSCVINKNEEIV